MADVLSEEELMEAVADIATDRGDSAAVVVLASHRELARRLAEAEATVERCRGELQRGLAFYPASDIRRTVYEKLVRRLFPAARTQEKTT